MEERKKSMDFIDECVAELRLDDDVTHESGQVTADTAVKMTEGSKINSTKVDDSPETNDNVCGVDGEEVITKTVKSAITLTLSPVTKQSSEKINPTGNPKNTSSCYTMVTNHTGSDRRTENGHLETVCLREEVTLAGDVDTACPVCGDSYKDPRVLPCLHSACLHCIYTLRSPDGPGEQLLLHCPVCAENVEAFTDIDNLPPNTLVSVKTKSVKGIKGEIRKLVLCGFCCEEERAVAVVTCVDCASDLCQLCSDSHKRQRRTKHHRLVGISTTGITERQADDSSGTSYDVMTLHQLVQDANHKRDYIQKCIDDIPSTRKELHDNAHTITKEIDTFIDSFVSAVELHRKSLLKQVGNILKSKETKLQLHEENLCRLLSSFENGCSIADDLSVYGTEGEIAALETTVSLRLNKLMDISSKECIPVETTFTFCPEIKAEVFDNFQMFGSVRGSQVCPNKCHVTTQDLTAAQVDIPTTVALTMRDIEDTPFPDPPGLCAWVRCGMNGQRRLAVTMRGRSDATYDLTFTPQHPGPHQLFVKVNKQDILGSPFKFDVKSKWREHSGTWHCCSFCSSAGKMDVSCGCGSIVRGSRGCWHAHPGYPGGPHWTCCGKMSRPSECIYAITKNDTNVLEVTL
ncbi:tripartite motif-containing protein 45-like [Pecten maximus]|uniref:tripartite motif-containing protein 45-like n=1 Tax=Pecten maximus TaxID=6579 RepID=UPI00145805D3|nr:tripartite motif-containing protein 45-like [Pecten maximus]